MIACGNRGSGVWIRDLARQGFRNPIYTNKESGIYLRRGIHRPESMTILNYLTWDELYNSALLTELLGNGFTIFADVAILATTQESPHLYVKLTFKVDAVLKPFGRKQHEEWRPVGSVV